MSFYRKNEIPSHLLEYFEPVELGLEATPDEYVAKMVAVFREVRRVLRDDGTLWLNLGDSYAGSGKGGNPPGSPHQKQRTNAGGLSVIGNTAREAANTRSAGDDRLFGLKPKDLLGVPWRVALALQADGWYLRSDIIWHKPNPMPESVTDRPTKSHEYVFLLSKNERYYYDAKAIAEEAIKGAAGSTFNTGKTATHQLGRASASDRIESDTRNARTVWAIATQPYSGAHFATMPPDLAERCIKAGTKRGDTVLDPFSGAGTTALVADRLGRQAIGIELNPSYAALSQGRVHDDAPLFADGAA